MNQIPRRPRPVPNRQERSQTGNNNQATFLALAVLVFLGLLLIALCALVMPSILGFVLVGFGFFFFAAFHYVVWGWWLSDKLRNADEPASDPPDENALQE